jgi:hypothetical protein
MSERLSRGEIISLLVGIPAAVAVTAAAASAGDTAQATAKKKSLAYVDKSTTAGKTCANCGLFKATSAGNGACLIIPGGTVAAAGWCKSWVPQAKSAS